MDQLVNVILAIDKVLTELQSVIDCSSGLGGLNQIYGPNCPNPYTQRRVQLEKKGKLQYKLLATMLSAVCNVIQQS